MPLTVAVSRGELTPIRGWHSPDYGERQPAPVLTYSTVTRLPLRIVTLLLPSEDPTGPLPDASVLVGEGSAPVVVAFKNGTETLRIDEQEVSVTHSCVSGLLSPQETACRYPLAHEQ